MKAAGAARKVAVVHRLMGADRHRVGAVLPANVRQAVRLREPADDLVVKLREREEFLTSKDQ